MLSCNQAPYLKMYKEYSSNFETSTERSREIREYTAISTALDVSIFKHFQSSMHQLTFLHLIQAVRNKCQQLTLETLLITPIQRLPRYNLLLEVHIFHVTIE